MSTITLRLIVQHPSNLSLTNLHSQKNSLRLPSPISLRAAEACSHYQWTVGTLPTRAIQQASGTAYFFFVPREAVLWSYAQTIKNTFSQLGRSISKFGV